MSSLGNLKTLSSLANHANQKRANTKEVLKVSTSQVISKKQVRTIFTNIDLLASSMKAEGQQTPIIVSPANADGKYEIQKGERRWRALQEAGIETIDIIVNDKTQTPNDEIIGELTENIQREDLEPMDVAIALKSLVDGGMKKNEIAERLGVRNQFVSVHLGILDMPAPAKELLDRGITKDPEVLSNLRQLSQLDDKLCRDACVAALDNGITRSQTRTLLKQAKEKEAAIDKEDDETIESTRSVTSSVTVSTESQQNIESSPKIPLQENSDNIDPKEWTSVDSVTVTVRVVREKDAILGSLLLNRVSSDTSLVWVKVDGKPIQVSADALEIVKVTS